MKSYSFEIDGGKTYPQGKPEWPYLLRLSMDKKKALALIRDLAHQVLTLQDDEGIEVPLVGKLGKTKDE